MNFLHGYAFYNELLAPVFCVLVLATMLKLSSATLLHPFW